MALLVWMLLNTLVIAVFVMLVLVAVLLQFLPAAVAVSVAFAVAMLVVAAYAWWRGLGARIGAAAVARRAGQDAVAVPVRVMDASGAVPDPVRTLGRRPLYLVVGRGTAELWRHAPVRLVPAVRLEMATLRGAVELDRDPEGWQAAKNRAVRLQFANWRLVLDVRHRVDATVAIRRLDPGPGRRPPGHPRGPEPPRPRQQLVSGFSQSQCDAAGAEVARDLTDAGFRVTFLGCSYDRMVLPPYVGTVWYTAQD